MSFTLLTPGPVQIHPKIQAALATQPPHHRSPEAQSIFKQIRQKLQQMIQSQNAPLLFISSATALMEALLINLQPKGPVGFIITGQFGQRWFKISQHWGFESHAFNVDPKLPFDWDRFEAFLKKQPFQVICLQSVDTSTGYQLDVREVSKRIRQIHPDALILVDSVTSWGCLPIRWDEWNVDALIGASQKGFMLPAGLGMVALSDRYLAQCQDQKGFFALNFKTEKTCQDEKNQMCWSAPMAHLVGLHKALEILALDDFHAHYLQVRNLAQGFRQVCELLGWKLLPAQPADSVSVVMLEPSKPLIQKLKEKGFWVADGQGDWQNKLFRVGHMGYCDQIIWSQFLNALWEAAQEVGYQTPSLKEIWEAGQAHLR